MIREKMNVDGYPFKFVIMFEDDDYYCFLISEDTVKELIIEFLKIILGNKYSSSKDYDTNKIFQGVNIRPEKDKISLFSKKKKIIALCFYWENNWKNILLFLTRIIVCSRTKSKKYDGDIEYNSKSSSNDIGLSKKIGMIQMKQILT